MPTGVKKSLACLHEAFASERSTAIAMFVIGALMSALMATLEVRCLTGLPL